MAKDPDLKSAYALGSKSEVTALYETWADSYDAGFGDAQGYQSPREVSFAFLGAGGTGPILDVGAGTGLVAEHFARASLGPIDALDISPDMLSVAKMKGLYRDLFVGDITGSLGIESDTYNGIVSAGTFTHGHVGPEGIEPLLKLAKKDSLFVLSVNQKHFEQLGFQETIDDLCERIYDVELRDVRIYDDRADADHRNDIACLLIFKKR
jgi:predicted TPR repeat methyltransferase